MPPGSFDILPYDVLVDIVSHVPVLDYYALKLADVNARDAAGSSPLLRFLQACEHGAGLDGFDEDGNSTQDLYIRWKKRVEVVEGKGSSAAAIAMA
ncbi:hypothetical protein ASPSYDRAFT_92321 [Aspergillus sydowii CBS 593.65]|uniref:F-box domain-containing protein n=1 Tax=Aspergillus sydowii CBS 593.65 TaxID=1036612 RepID=A0A1L9T9L1_9EURO|nr:uncharacterized protein ASPSYDRAFT_92321 [Aspergillus sydowii CBS 593.65]OJJ56128.1 hypothetical protein ASPSYDRAFT_92321 [Aspergillus sydowii CBS 593.65]